MITPAEHEGLNLPGYSLVARLGAGGYGEVWLAHAPGGLTKAVKFIYGSYHDKRAEHELRALQRIKDLRHPFLLSLERIEVVDGRLVIVTELADGSLKDRFDQCRQQGLPGVPREELLKYLRDAADALDFLSQKHSLQHLDVKPENLLLVAGHVKVADFGLVKDVGKSQASLVGGLTPLYSAPEVFQGNPSPYSDQYGLAVLYQEMLTGVLPFPGVTAAELTLQHLHDEPDLAALPTNDRYVLARALAKEPSQRFPCTSEMIQALLSGGAPDAQSWAQAATDGAASLADFGSPAVDRVDISSPRRPTESFDETFDSCPSQVSTSMLLDVEPRSDVAPAGLPPLQLPTDTCHGQPTLVIGVGGVAAAVLGQLRLRLTRQFGEESLPAVQMLLLDSDPKTIARAMQGDPRAALKPEETLPLPLRRPQEYREQSARLMKWLSRRWLYNIPRSLRTEGMRPLGRLAFADHARQAVQRIRMALSQAAAPESIALSRDAAGLEFTGKGPRVYVVASISGGAGSGMSLDVACAVRAVLEKMNAADACVLGVFLHAQGRDARHCDLAKVNAFSWLTEYNHFHRSGGAFPGDESCGLPALARPALDEAYLVDLGAGGDDADAGLEQAAQTIAEYLYLDALTPAQSFFDHCRREADAEPTAAAPLRTFSLRKIPAATDKDIDQAAAALSREVVLRWAGGDPHAMTQCAVPSVRDTNQMVQGAAKLVSQTQLKLDGLASNARSLIEAQFGGDQQTFLDSLLASAEREGRLPTAPELLAAIDRLFAPPGDAEAGAFILERPVEAITSPLVMKLAGDLARWVLAKLDDRQERLAGAQRAVDWLVDHLKRVEDDAARMSAGLARQIAGAAEETRRDTRTEAPAPETIHRRTLAYFRMRIDQQAVAASGAIARRLLTELKTIGQTIAEFGRHLKHLASSLPGNADINADLGAPLTAALAEHGPALADAIDGQIQDAFLAASGGLFQTIMGNSRVRAQMLVVLSKFARRAAEKLAARPDVMHAAFATIADGASPAPTSDDASSALPTFLQAGGVYRSLTVVPVECPGNQAAKLCHGPGDAESTVLVAPGHDVVAVCEGWQLPLVNVAIDLINNRRDYADFAARVQTRSDVQWMPLTSPAARQPIVNAFADFASGAPTVTQVL